MTTTTITRIFSTATDGTEVTLTYPDTTSTILDSTGVASEIAAAVGVSIQAHSDSLDTLATNHIPSDATDASVLLFDEATNNGTESLALYAPAQITASYSVALPSESTTLVGTIDVATLTNKTINSADNTITITTSDISDFGSYLTATDIGSTVQAYSNKLDDLVSNYLIASASNPTALKFYERTDNGTNSIEILGQNSVAGNYIVLLPTSGGTLVTESSTDTLTNKTFNSSGTGNSITITTSDISDYTPGGDLVDDLTPQLGGDLSLNGFDFTDTNNNAILSFEPTLNAVNHLALSNTGATEGGNISIEVVGDSTIQNLSLISKGVGSTTVMHNSGTGGAIAFSTAGSTSETTATIVSPQTSDITLTLPAATGTVALLSDITNSGGAWTLVSTQTISSVAEVAFTDLTGSSYWIKFTNIIPVQNDVTFSITTSSDNGVTYASSGYKFILDTTSSLIPVVSVDQSATEISINVSEGVSSVGSGISGDFYFSGMNSSTFPASVNFNGNFPESTTLNIVKFDGSGMASANATNAIKFSVIFSTFSGAISLYSAVE